MIEIRRVGNERNDQLVATLAAGFMEDPFIGWVLSESPYERREAQLRWWTGALAAMSDVAVFHATQDSSAVAVWIPPHDPARAAPDSADEANAFVNLVLDVCGAGADERLGFFAELAAQMPSVPHWHLTAVAVQPAQQGEGLGAKVIKAMLDQCDRLEVPAYLEATTARSRVLYERLGFETTSTMGPTPEVRLAIMWREPGGRS